MLELELADLKIQQHQAKAAQEHAQMQLYAEQVSQLMTTEKNLRLQLASDGERFQQFQVLSLIRPPWFLMAWEYVMEYPSRQAFGPNQVGWAGGKAQGGRS